MQVLMGTVTSAPCVAVADKTNADNMFQITPSGSSVECAQNPNVFRVCFSDPDQGAASATYIAENKLAEKIAVIYDSSDVYSSGIYEKFAAEAANQGLEISSRLTPWATLRNSSAATVWTVSFRLKTLIQSLLKV